MSLRMGFCAFCGITFIGLRQLNSDASCPACSEPRHWLVMVPTGWTVTRAKEQYAIELEAHREVDVQTAQQINQAIDAGQIQLEEGWNE